MAAAYLQQKGYTILERNAYTRFGELDIIAHIDSFTVFVEVKTKTSPAGRGEPWEMVSQKKYQQVRRMAEQWLVRTGQAPSGIRCRIDVIGVWLDSEGNQEKLEHWENVCL